MPEPGRRAQALRLPRPCGPVNMQEILMAAALPAWLIGVPFILAIVDWLSTPKP